MSVENRAAGSTNRTLLRLQRETRRLAHELTVATQQVPHLRQMIEFCPDGLALLSSTGVVIEHNAVMSEIFAHSGDLLHQQSLADLVAPLLTDGAVTDLFDAPSLAACLSEARTVLLPLRSGPVELRVSGWVESDGARFLVSARPVGTDDHKERALLQARQQIAVLDARLREQRQQDETARLDSLSVLASTMVHDLNNALAVVHANVEMLREELGPGAHTDLLDDACSGTRRVQELVTRLRSFSMGPTLMLQQLCLSRWIVDFLRPIASGQGARLDLETSEEGCWVAADENQLSQVFLNLAINGTQAAAGLGIQPELRVRVFPAAHGFLTGTVVRPVAEAGSPHLLITVEDNGPGIPRTGFARLFTPFHTTKSTGSGLGLASVARIIHLHRGGVAVENRPEGGARFTVALPLLTVCSSADPIEAPTEALRAVDRLQGVSVLVMDDEPMVRSGIRRQLVASGARVTEVSRGEELLAAYAAARDRGELPVCIVDIHIDEGMGGMAVMAVLRERWPDVQAIACTGHAEVQTTAAFGELGFSDWLLKPYEAERLRQAVHRLAFRPGPGDR